MKHSTTIKNPLQWYDALCETIKATECKMDGKNVPFQKGLEQTISLLTVARQKNATVFWVGNGGSAAICSHLSQDILNKLEIKSLYSGDFSLMTCMANDFGYEQVYAKPLKFFIKKNDLLIAISSSGNSENILLCTKLANKIGAHIISLSGMNPNNKLFNSISDVSFFVQSDLYGIVETSHEAILHGIIETLWLNIRCPQERK